MTKIARTLSRTTRTTTTTAKRRGLTRASRRRRCASRIFCRNAPRRSRGTKRAFSEASRAREAEPDLEPLESVDEALLDVLNFVPKIDCAATRARRCHDMEERALFRGIHPVFGRPKGSSDGSEGRSAGSTGTARRPRSRERDRRAQAKHFVGGDFADLPAEAFATNGALALWQQEQEGTDFYYKDVPVKARKKAVAEKEAEPETTRVVVFANAYERLVPKDYRRPVSE